MEISNDTSEEDVAEVSTNVNLVETSTTELYISNMPLGIIQHTVSMLNIHDTINYCNASEEMIEKCKRGGIVERRAQEIVASKAPLAENVSDVIDHALLLHRGFVTSYHTLPWNTIKAFPKGITTIFAMFGVEKNAVNFTLPGLPAKRETIVHLLVDAFNEDDPTLVSNVYLSLDEMGADMLKPYREQQEAMKSFTESIWDDCRTNREIEKASTPEEFKAVYFKVLETIIQEGRYGQNDCYRYYQIQLP